MGPPPVPGCLVNIRVTRLTAVQGQDGWIMQGSEHPLLEGACMQFPSHASGDVTFGPDGYLYASAGDGASFDTEDYGQGGNPCPGDPVNEGGSLRSQDLRTSGDTLSVSGAIVRINPADGLAADGSNDNAKRIVTYGQRNPWRLTFRPGDERAAGRAMSAGAPGKRSTGPTWPPSPTPSTSAGRATREPPPASSSSPAGTRWISRSARTCTPPRRRPRAPCGAVLQLPDRGGGLLTPGENCQQGTSSISGVAFAPSTSSYPTDYRGSLFFNDYARGCIWRLGKLGNGNPDPSSIMPFVEAAETPVGIEIGPGGDLFYVDYGIGEQGFPEPGEVGSTASPTRRPTRPRSRRCRPTRPRAPCL